MIDVLNRQRLVRINEGRLTAVAVEFLCEMDRRESSVTVVLLRDRAIRKLNQSYRGKNVPTDVLSFSGDGELQPNHLGDVVIATDTAQRQAEEAGITLEREISELLVHGLLHLCGYDHETDGGEMNDLELKLRRKLLGKGPKYKGAPKKNASLAN